MTNIKHHRYPLEVVQYALKLFQVDQLSYREVELNLKLSGIDVSYKTVHEWVQKFGRNYKFPKNSKNYYKKTEVFENTVKINGKVKIICGLKTKSGLVVGLMALNRKPKKVSKQ